jgi:zinc/manganese transport system substrate-binding protein
MRLGFAAMIGVLAIGAGAAHSQPVKIVAAENFYGDIARQIGGADVAVTSILSNPDQDPHEFEASPSTARALADAAVVVYNGADYDPWAAKLLGASPSSSRQTIVAATLVGKKSGDNPHVWYDPNTAAILAGTLAGTLAKLDLANQTGYRSRLATFDHSMTPLAGQISALKRKYAGMAVTATEPVFGYMADALGLDMRDRRFQLAVMNDTEPSAADIAAFERDLRSRAVKLLIYNNQTSDALTRHMRVLAQEAGVPVVGVSETEPPDKDYQEWMRSQLDAIDRALAHPPR